MALTLTKKSDAALNVVPAWHPNLRNVENLPDTKVVRTAFFVNGFAMLVAVSLARGQLLANLASALAVLRPLAVRGTVVVAPKTKTMLPYGCAIAFGATVVALANSVAPYLRLPI